MTTPLGTLANLVAAAELAGMESEVLDEAREALAIIERIKNKTVLHRGMSAEIALQDIANLCEGK